MLSVNHKRRYLIVDSSSVFHSLVLRALLRVYKNKTNGIEIRKTENEKTALHLISNEFMPDIVITKNKLLDSFFTEKKTITYAPPFNQDELVNRIHLFIAYQYAKKESDYEA